MSGPIPCPSCGEPVPPGRLACPSCGALVASVARPEPAAAEGPGPVPEPEPAAPRPAAPRPAPPKATTPEAPLGAAPLAAWAPKSALQPPPGAAPPAPPAVTAAATSGPADAPARIDDAVAADGIASGGIVPGAYLPPSTVHRAGAAAPGAYPAPAVSGGPPTWAPSVPPAPPATSVGWVPPTPGGVGGSAAGAPPVASPAAAAPPPDGRETRTNVPGRASILADLPFDAPDQLEGWLVALGGGFGVLGFFLPWTGAIGEGLEGYLGSWGLGAASRLPVFVLLVVVAALAVLPNRVAPWVRTGVLGMVSGGITFGLVWLYLGSDASQLGALLCAVGAILLIAGGIIAVAPGRSANRRDGD